MGEGYKEWGRIKKELNCVPRHTKITNHSKKEANNGPLHCKYIIKGLSFVVAGV